MLQNNAFLSRLELIWPISSLKISKMSKKCGFGKKGPGVNGLIEVHQELSQNLVEILFHNKHACDF